MLRCRIAAAHGRFSGIHQVATVCIPSNTCFLGPTRVQIPNGISIGSAVFAQLTAESRYILQRAALKLPLPKGDLDSHLIRESLDLSETITLYNGPPFSPQNYPFPCRDLPSI